MKPLVHILLVLVLLQSAHMAARADPADLADGVFIIHNDPFIWWSDPPSHGAVCEEYFSGHAITSCDEQNPTIFPGGTQVWFVLAQWWDEEKTWCLSEFGFGEFDPNVFVFISWGPCSPGNHIEARTGAWPGPNSGTAVATVDVPWHGNFTPVYYFSGYAYSAAPGLIPLAPDPTATPFAGFLNCAASPAAFEAVCLPALGVLMDGVECCSVRPPDGACCFGGSCEVLTEQHCAQQGGAWLPDYPDCGPPNPCLVRACCVGDQCVAGWNEQTCAANGGEFQRDHPACEPTTCQLAACCHGDYICTVTTAQGCHDFDGLWYYPWLPDCTWNPCPQPVDNMSWGRIKAIYR